MSLATPLLVNVPTRRRLRYFSVAVGGVSVSQTRDRIDDVILLTDAISRQIPGSKVFDCQLVRNMATKCVAAATAFESYMAKKTKPNTLAFNKAVITFLHVNLKVDQQADCYLSLLRACLLGLAPVIMEHRAVQTEKHKDAEAELNHAVCEAQKIAGGLRLAVSWKSKITPVMTVADIIDIASADEGLLSGPGSKIAQLKGDLAKSISAYKVECARYGVTDLKTNLIEVAEKLGELSQVTAFESQLCRCLKKPEVEQQASILKYLGLYAHVVFSDVQPLLYKRAQTVVKGST